MIVYDGKEYEPLAYGEHDLGFAYYGDRLVWDENPIKPKYWKDINMSALSLKEQLQVLVDYTEKMIRSNQYSDEYIKILKSARNFGNSALRNRRATDTLYIKYIDRLIEVIETVENSTERGN